ncbi:MAG: hypothetical protein AAFY74_20350, partial [Pseudomonadota bacterium]
LDLDDLESWGKEPELADDWFLDAPTPERCEPNLEAAVRLLPRAPRQPTDRQCDAVTCVEQAITATEFAAAIGTAHIEDPTGWGKRIALAMDGRERIKFWALIEATGLSSGELLLGLLLGGWRMEPQGDDFYGDFVIRGSQNQSGENLP